MNSVSGKQIIEKIQELGTGGGVHWHCGTAMTQICIYQNTGGRQFEEDSNNLEKY